MTNLFDIEKFNVISDDENYYFFRSLEPGDIEDIENGVIKTENGYSRLRTDRERWEESHNGNAEYSKDSQVSLEEMYNHIKYGYSLQTNCISLTSNPYIAKMYGEQFSQNYVMITVPKKEMGESVFLAGPYMLGEVQKRVEDFLENNEVEASVLEDLEKVDQATDSKEIRELIKTRYTSEKPIDTRKSSMRKDITYSAPHSRISRWQALDEEQNLAKNKIIGKLTILEKKGRMPRILKKSKDNRKLLVNIGGSFSSAEQIYYGEIVGERVQDISKEMLDMLGLVQQAESQDRELVKELESELIRAVKDGKQLEIVGKSPLNSTYEVKSDISIEEMYELTDGKVDYTKANDVVQKMFYLSRSRLYAVELSKGLNQLTGNNPKYKDIIDYIEKNGFNIEPQIFNRKTDSGLEVVGTVNLSLNENEKVLVEKIKELAPEEYIQVLENGGLSDVQNIISSTFSSLKLNEQMSKESYYAQAIVDSYNWNEMSEKGLNDEARKELIEKLQEFDVIEIYQNLKKAGVQEKDISKYILNIVSRESLLNAEDFSKMLLENDDVLKHKLSVEQVDRFLGYYDVKDSNFELRDYQQDAFDKSKELLSSRGFAAVVMPTGGGKSFVTMQHLLEHKNEKMLYLAPDDEILNQMMDYIIEYIPGLSKTSENTSKKEIVKQVFPNMEFETYPGLMATRSKELLKEQFDFIVLDELHRTGAEKWEKKLDELLQNQEEKNRVLGITATPTRDIDGRDMSVETAVKLGYTREKAEKGEHIAYYLDLVEAIQLGLVVNPKIVSCEYTLTQDGGMERLKEKIESIEDEKIKAEKMKKFNELSRSLEKAEGIPEILQKYVKPGQKYIVFLPSTAMQTEDDKKIGEAKIEEYKKKLEEYFKDSEITPEFYSMLGTYSKGKNESQLREFETSSSPDTKFMIVIDKAREGLHIAGLNGMVWFRPLDENSNILYHQQLGRVIHSEDPLNPTKDEDRPIVIDLANNTFRVRMDKQVKTYTSRSDLDLLCAVIDWVQNHNGGVLPDVEVLSKQEKRYAATLYRLQNKYLKYFDDELLKTIEPKEQEEIQAIIDKGYEIDLWDTELFPPIPEEKIGEILKVDAFEVNGVLKDFVELEEEIEDIIERATYEEVMEFLESHDGGLMRGTIRKDGKALNRAEMNEEEKEEVNLYHRWLRTNERKVLEEYAGRPIEEVPEEYREKIERLREFGLGRKEKTTYEEVIEFLESHDGQIMKSLFKDKNGEKLKRGEMTQEEQEEVKLYARWIRTYERKILEEYAGKPIEEVAEEYREKIARLREFGLGRKEKTTYEEVIEFLETHEGKLMRGAISNEGKQLTRSKMTQEEQDEVNLSDRWKRSNEKKVLEEYAGRSIEEVPEEYREKIAKLRALIKEKTTYEEVIEFLETHEGKLMRGMFTKEGKNLKREEMTQEEQDEVNLYQRWNRSNERKVLEEYAGRPIEEVPEEYREKIVKLRVLIKEKTTYEEVIEFLETHEGKLMRGGIKINGKKLKRGEMTQEEQDEVNLYQRWIYSNERKVLEEYAGRPIEEVPEEYRGKIARLREFGLGMKRSKLSKAKQSRDDAKTKNNKAKELEEQVAEELKKRGKNHEEQ